MDRTGKRRNTPIDGKLAEAINAGQISEKQLEILSPLFDHLRNVIHENWERLTLKDEETARILKYQLHAVNELQRSLTSKIDQAKIALNKLEKSNGQH